MRLLLAAAASATLHCHLLKGGASGRPFVGFPGNFKGGFGGGYSDFRGDFQSAGFAPSGFAQGPFGVGPAAGGPSGFGPGLPTALALPRQPPVTFIPGGQTKVILVKVKHLGTTTHHPTGFNGPPLGPPFGLPSSAGFGSPLKSAKGGWW
ncbi:hypothetical protein HPB50_023500 [Hyalomma asiaticum]|uniref:Uncharacterized protein n=1 Tax=Hyalomma asiaticum TaxID=266040 RepID=A0ACB7SB59_HYAAI|nr:hypothetical protein HPB50_023500 [Hyalomma asiaticum]